MNTVLEALAAYRSFDPAKWIDAYQAFPVWAGILMVIAGVLLLLEGGGKYFRFVAAPLGLWVGAIWVPVVLAQFGFTAPSPTLVAAAAVGLAALGVAHPTSALFIAIGIPSGIFLGQLAGSSEWFLGFVPGFLIGGAVAVAAYRWISAVTACGIGAWLVVIGLLAALHQLGGLVQTMTANVWAIVIAAALFTAAGSIYQVLVRPSPEEKERLAAERARAKRKLAEQKALEKRWANYSANRK